MRKILASLAAFFVVFFTFSVSPVSAKVITSEEQDITVAKEEVINDDLFIGAQGATIDGVVNGDVFVGAQNVRIGGTINGNLHAGTQTFYLTGNVKGSIYIGAQDILITNSVIGGSVISGSQNINIDKNSTIGGSIISGAEKISIESKVKRSVYAAAGFLTISKDAKIGKDLYCVAGNEVGTTNVNEKSVAGTIYKTEMEAPEKDINAAKKLTPQAVRGTKIFGLLMSLIGALIVGYIYLKLFGEHLTKSTETLSKSFWKSLGIGFLIMMGAFPAFLILLMTIIGAPIAGLGILVLLIFMYLAKIVVGFVFGSWIKEKLKLKTGVYASFALGLTVIYILKSIPILGFTIGSVVFLSGVGALSLTIFSKK